MIFILSVEEQYGREGLRPRQAEPGVADAGRAGEQARRERRVRAARREAVAAVLPGAAHHLGREAPRPAGCRGPAEPPARFEQHVDPAAGAAAEMVGFTKTVTLGRGDAALGLEARAALSG